MRLARSTSRRGRRGRRRGFTLTELLVAMGLGGGLMAVTSILLVSTLAGFDRQSRQGEMNWRVRILARTFTQDTQDAYQLVYSGSSAYTPPALTAPASYNTTGPNGQVITSVPAATKVLVFEVPSYDSSGYFIQNSFDYIGYSWTQPAAGTAGSLSRTCIPRTGSARTPTSQIIPAGGTYDANVTISFHVSGTYTAIAGYGGNTYADTATTSTGNPLFQGSSPTVGLAQVDAVVLGITLQATSWGQPVAQSESISVAMKEWGRTLGATGGASGAPSAPAGVGTISGNTQVTVSWTSVTNAASYTVKRSATTGGPYSNIAVLSSASFGTPPATSYTDTSLTNGTTYYYVVSAANWGGLSSPNSVEVSATPSSTGPHAPSNVTATPNVGSVVLAWTGASNSASFNVKRSTTSGGPYTTIANTTSSTYSDTSVVGGTTYYYVISALNNGGNEGSSSSEVSATAITTAPTAPTGLSAAPYVYHSQYDINLFWTQSTGSNVTQNRIYRSLVSGTGYSLVTTISAGTSYQDVGLSNGTTYYYVVTAVNGSGQESGYSGEAAATA